MGCDTRLVDLVLGYGFEQEHKNEDEDVRAEGTLAGGPYDTITDALDIEGSCLLMTSWWWHLLISNSWKMDQEGHQGGKGYDETITISNIQSRADNCCRESDDHYKG